MLKDVVMKYYQEQNYNCAESVIRGANEYYELGLHDRDMIMTGGFGAGMQTGSSCGAVLSSVAVLSMKYIEAKAHESTDIKPVTTLFLNKIKEKLGSTMCCDVKPIFFEKEIRCQKTVCMTCDILEEVLSEYQAK